MINRGPDLGYQMIDLVDHGLRCVAYDRASHHASSPLTICSQARC